MAMLDRLRDAARPTNTIEVMQQPEPQRRPADLHSASPDPVAETPQQPAKKPAGDPKAAAYTTEPEAISKAYYVEQQGSERRYFDDYQRKALAIRTNDSAISTKREDLNTIRAMMTLAEARGWSEIKVNGSTDFKREAWIEATARGISAQGYKASDLDRQEADRRHAERGPAPQRTGPEPGTNEIRQAVTSAPAPAQQQATLAASVKPDDTPQRVAPAAPTPAPSPAKSEERTPQAESQRHPADLHSASPGSAAEAPKQAATPTRADHGKELKDAKAELSPDGRLVLGAVSEKIDRQMNKLNSEAKAEMKAYFATELVKKERAEGPVVLSAELKRLATAPEPAPKQQPTAQPQQTTQRGVEPEEPRRTRSR